MKGNPNHDGRTSVPILWDKKIEQIVNNERPDIIKMINSQFNYLSKLNYTDIYPKELQKEIDESQEWILPKI